MIQATKLMHQAAKILDECPDIQSATLTVNVDFYRWPKVESDVSWRL